MRHILIFVCFTTSILHGQKYEGDIYFNSGKIIKGYIQIIDDDILYRKTKKDKRVIYDFSKIDSVSFFDKNKILRKFQYIKLNENDNPILAYVKIDDFLRLYKIIRDRTIIKNEKIILTDSEFNATEHRGREYELKQATATFFLKRRNEKFATYFISYGTEYNKKTKKFKEVIYEYFKDCSAILEKVDGKAFKKKDYLRIVEYYNEECN